MGGPSGACADPHSLPDLDLAAGIVASYGDRGTLPSIIVRRLIPGQPPADLPTVPLPRETYTPWML